MNITLRALEPEDLSLLYRIENDKRLWCYGETTSPYSQYQLRNYLQSVTNDAFRDGQVRMAIATEQGETLGFADLQNISALHGRAEVGIVILPECQRCGAALAALRQLEDYAHCQLHLHQLIAFVSADNQPSLALFEKAGYKKTATLPEWLSTPEGWADMCVFSLRL